MTLDNIYGKLRRLPAYITNKTAYVRLNVSDLKEIIEGREDTEFVSVPLKIKVTSSKGEPSTAYLLRDEREKVI